MYKWISSITGWTHVRYIDMGTVIGNSYLGWKKPRRKQQYVTVNSSTGNIDWYYKFVNGSWIRTNSNNVDCQMVPTNFTVTVNAEHGTATSAVNTPNTIDAETGEVTKMTVANVNLTLTATAAEGYEFVKWKKGDVDYSVENPLVDSVDDDNDLEYTAVFQVEG